MPKKIVKKAIITKCHCKISAEENNEEHNKIYRPTVNTNTNKESEKGKTPPPKSNQTPRHKMSQRKQNYTNKTNAKHEKYKCRSVLIPHKQLQTT